MHIKTVIHPRNANYTLEDLIEGLKRNDPNEIQSLWRKFYLKFGPYVWKVAYNKCRHFPSGSDLAKDIFQITFINATRGIHKFQLKEDLDEISKERSIKAWLGRIAANAFLKEYEKWNSIDLPEDLESSDIPREEDFHFNHEEEPIEISSEVMSGLRIALTTLTEREREIILAYADEGCIGTDLHLSDTSIKYLCNRFTTNPQNIRKIKNRALQKIRNLCSLT
jgi:RNA polymerase sigma factor (sigma-70 family)